MIATVEVVSTVDLAQLGLKKLRQANWNLGSVRRLKF
jgi:hypothetical protein